LRVRNFPGRGPAVVMGSGAAGAEVGSPAKEQQATAVSQRGRGTWIPPSSGRKKPPSQEKKTACKGPDLAALGWRLTLDPFKGGS